MRNILGWCLEVFIIVLIIFSLVGLLAGCSSWQPRPDPLPVTPIDPIVKVIHSTDWFMSIMMVACVVSLFAGLNGMKMGWAGLVACIGGLVIKSALSSVYVYWICGIVFLVSVSLGVFSILFKNKALKEIITGVQLIRDNSAKEEKENITGYLDVNQSNTTKKLVKKIKTILKRKEFI